MWSYILKRLLLMIPTLLGILMITFVIVQFVPGGPVEQMVSQLQGREAGGEGPAATSGSGGWPRRPAASEGASLACGRRSRTPRRAPCGTASSGSGASRRTAR